MARIHFLIGGVQKAGTTALAELLRQHPRIRLPRDKEAHVFDAPDFDDTWGGAEIDSRFARCFDEETVAAPDLRFGDATPITILHPRFIDRAQRYQPQLRWIVLLREPAERAYSQWHMQRQRGQETASFWRALLCEPRRLRGHHDDFGPRSPLREQSYRHRGDYARQLDQLLARVPQQQILILRSEDLSAQPLQVLRRVYAHLGLPEPEAPAVARRIFEGGYRRDLAYRGGLFLARWLLRRQRRELQQRYGIAWPDRSLR